MASHKCPVCRTPLWTDPLFTPARLRCPRCGNEFKPTVPWHYVRLLLIVVVALSILVVVLLTRGNFLWLLSVLVIAGVAACLWYLGRLIDLQRIGPELTPEEGILDSRQLKLRLEDKHVDEIAREREEQKRFRKSIFFLALLGVTMIAVVIWWTFS